MRPATGELYGLSNQNNIYKINPMTGAAPRSDAESGAGGRVKAIDFNPTVDRIRVLGSGGAVKITCACIPIMAWRAWIRRWPLRRAIRTSETPRPWSTGYLNSFSGATTTTLYDFEAGNDFSRRRFRRITAR